ncbi:hypothetical protein OSB04_011000 [Centaurea solstitialis]|uniref:CCHC-type domain-containing protein n=1 Tax=Centaurea solstitialis TaxID=347529 RepID=A0AA38WPS1_9ASTR|nr:hypothetical protein OSB04_011000 [Centaurea solstitialis]
MAELSSKDMTTKFAKLEKFQCVDFRRWQKKMHFLLTTLNVVHILSSTAPEEKEDETPAEIRKRCKWENDDYICRGHIYNGMSDPLFDIYQNVKNAKQLWNDLESKYIAEDASSKKFLKDFKHTLKHQKEELSLVQLGSHIRIEESLRGQESDKNKAKPDVGQPSVHMVEGNKINPKHKGKGIKRKFEDRNKPNKNSNVLVCWRCNMTGHLKRDCRVNLNKRGNVNNGAGSSGGGNYKPNGFAPQKGQNFSNLDKPMVYVCSLILESFYVQDDHCTWWIDSGATSHMCRDRRWFEKLALTDDGSIVKMGDESTAKVCGVGIVNLTFTSGKTITLNHVLFVPRLRKNLVSGGCLNSAGFKQVYESDNFILCRFGTFIGLGYFCYGMFRLNVLIPFSDDNDCLLINSSSNDSSKIDDNMLWHARLGHVNFRRMLEMSKYGLIPLFDIGVEKCKTCMLTKITKQPFHCVIQKSNLLDLIHSDLCDFHATPSLGNKKYAVTFIDDSSRFCYVYLLHSKDEALEKFKIYKTEVELQLGVPVKCLRTDRGGEYMDPHYFQSVVVKLTEPKRSALGERGVDCIFIGYAEHSKAYRFYVIDPNESVTVNTVIESLDAIFDEERFSSIPRPKDLISNVDKDAAFWKEAIDDELSSILENNTWVLSDLPPGFKPLGCKWIFKKKMKVDGTIDKFKARLVIQGFRQKPGIVYFDTYAPVARISTIRLLIALAAIHKLVVHQMDVKTAFLNGELDEEVYMKQPEGFVPSNEHKVCKLVKSLYGLKQAPKQWHQQFDEVILSSGFKLNQSDKYVYSRFDSSGSGVIICLYVDDMLIFGTDQLQVDETKSLLSSKFAMKDLGEADVILGIRIKRVDKGIALTQSHYVEKILKKINYSDCSPVSTPMDPSVKLMPNKGMAISQLEYSQAIGWLMYAMTSTRPDIAYAVGRLGRYTSNPSTQHWQAIQRVFKYLKGTMDYGLYYLGYPSVLEGYSDASWITHVEEDHSSTTGWVFLLGGGAISWASKKQTCITNSTMESEFVALAAAGKEAESLRNLIYEIPLWSKPIAPISIHCDSAVTLAKAYS